MLKWTNSAQKLAQLGADCASVTKNRSPRFLGEKRQRRSTTICDIHKENIPYTSTPMVSSRILRTKTFESPKTPIGEQQKTPQAWKKSVSERATYRRHSTLGINLPCNAHAPQYASTLPRFEEEYSPSTVLPTGQELALRGLLPDIFVGNLRYFSSPQLAPHAEKTKGATRYSSLPKRKLEPDLEQVGCCESKRKSRGETTVLSSAKMGDHTLDNLIDAILESACKTQKKKKTRKSLNLRRRTLLKTQTDNNKELCLSPSYAAGDDPASDLSFLLIEPTTAKRVLESPKALPPTPVPHSPGLNAGIPRDVLLRMPTPAPLTPGTNRELTHLNVSTTTFNLETPIRPAKKRRSRHCAGLVDTDDRNATKKSRRETCNYFEVGLDLPSIYV